MASNPAIDRARPLHEEIVSIQQIAFYKAFGFVVLRRKFSKEDVADIASDFNAVMQDCVDEYTNEHQQAVCAIEHQPNFKRLLPRLMANVEQILGPGFVMMGSNSYTYASCGTPWHADLGWHPSMFKGGKEAPVGHYYNGLKIGIYLDPLTHDTGCLRVIPASHMLPDKCLDLIAPIHGDVPSNFSDDGTIKGFNISPVEVPCYAVESEPGDVIFFNNQTWHASFGGKAGKRMIQIDNKAKPRTDREHEHIRAMAEDRRKYEHHLPAKLRSTVLP